MALEMNARNRRLLYSLNVILAAALALLLVVLATWGAGRLGWRADFSASGVNSLSPRTIALLRELPEDVSVTGIHTSALREMRPFAERRRERMSDLLELYESTNRGKVKTRMIDAQSDQAALKALLAGLREKPEYKDESKPHQTAIESFKELSPRLSQALSAEASEMTRLLETAPNLGRVREFVIVQRNFSSIAQDGQSLTDEIQELLNEEVPSFARAVQNVNEHLSRASTVLKDSSAWMTGESQASRDLTPDAKSFLAAAAGRLAPLLTEVDALVTKSSNLPRAKLEDAVSTLKRGDSAIIVETPREVRVIPSEDIWVMNFDPNSPRPADQDPADFGGEQAVSSAILQLTKKEKVGVVFVRFGGESAIRPDFSRFNPAMGQLPRAPYGILNDVLQKENFVTAEWDVSTQPTPPPVEGVTKTLYVVLPPEPPGQPNPMQPTPQAGISPQQIKQVTDAVAAAGMAIFLTGWAEPQRGRFGGMGGPGSYEYAEYLKTAWGIDVQYRYLAVHFAPSVEKPDLWVPASGLLLDTSILKVAEHAIVKPLRGVEIGLHMVCPLRATETLPAGVSCEPLLSVETADRVWAFDDIARVEQDLQTRRGTTRGETDITPPFHVAVAASGEGGKRVVVFASERFAGDALLSQMTLNPATLRVFAAYPGNQDLFLNAIHWLTGDASRIAIGPRRGAAPRLEGLKDPAQATFWKVFLVSIWPATALLAGAGVWMIRRR